jgi:hypothetical protein
MPAIPTEGLHRSSPPNQDISIKRLRPNEGGVGVKNNLTVAHLKDTPLNLAIKETPKAFPPSGEQMGREASIIDLQVTVNKGDPAMPNGLATKAFSF